MIHYFPSCLFVISSLHLRLDFSPWTPAKCQSRGTQQCDCLAVCTNPSHFGCYILLASQLERRSISDPRLSPTKCFLCPNRTGHEVQDKYLGTRSQPLLSAKPFCFPQREAKQSSWEALDRPAMNKLLHNLQNPNQKWCHEWMGTWPIYCFRCVMRSFITLRINTQVVLECPPKCYCTSSWLWGWLGQNLNPLLQHVQKCNCSESFEKQGFS